MRRAAVIALVFLIALPLLAQQQQPQPPAPPEEPPISPETLWNALVQGNRTFMAGKVSYDTLAEERVAYKDRQMPPVTVLSCSDSRVPPELVFNQSLGVLFVVRSMGSVADDFGVASIEHAINSGYTKLLVVLGHENCGAVRASMNADDPQSASIRAVVQRIRSSFVGVNYDSRDAANLRKAVEMNTRASAAYLRAASPVIRNAEMTARIQIVTAVYDMATGQVRKVE